MMLDIELSVVLTLKAQAGGWLKKRREETMPL